MQKETVFNENKQVFWERNLGYYHTPKKINRSTKSIDSNFVDNIELGLITSLDLKEVGKTFPIFIYKTCITVHGTFPNIARKYIGGYKNIHQNANGSLEIKYNAIDYNQKKTLAELLPSWGWNRNSYIDNFILTFDTYNIAEAQKILAEQKAIWQNKKIEGMTAKISISGYCYFGRYYIFVTICPLLIENNIIDIAAAIRNEPRATLLAEQAQNKIIAEQKNNEYSARQIKNKLQEDEKATNKANILKTLSHLQKVTPKTAGLYTTITYTVSGKWVYKHLKLIKGTFGRFIVHISLSNSLEMPNEFRDFFNGKQLKTSDIDFNGIYQ